MGIYRPILRWSAAAVFDAAAYAGVKPNPLYSQGCKRVGCMPCINSGKGEILNAAKRWPKVINRVEEWEAIVGAASKRGASTLFHVDPPGGRYKPEMSAQDIFDQANIRSAVEWSRTSHGGRQFDMLALTEAPACSSAYGLCE